MARAELSPIFDRLNGVAGYHPLSANTFGDWAMEAGDIVTVSRNGEEFSAPIHVSKVRWNGKQEIGIEANGEKERAPISKMSARKYDSGGNTYRGGYRATKQAQEIYSEIWSSDSTLYSVISQTASAIRTEVGNTASNLYSSITQTAEEIRSEVWGSGSSVYSLIQQTRDGILTEVGNTNSAIYTRISQTASEITSEVRSTASGLYSSIKQTIDAITLDASKINIGTAQGSTINLGEVLGINSSGAAIFKKQVFFSTGAANSRTTNIYGGTVSADTLQTQVGGTGIVVLGANDAQRITLNYSTLTGMVESFRIVGNTLYLKAFGASEQSFSKAVTYSGAWDGNMTVAAGKSFKVTVNGENHWSPAVNQIYQYGSAVWDNDYKGFTVKIRACDADGTDVKEEEIWFSAGTAYYQGSQSVQINVSGPTWDNSGYAYGQSNWTPTARTIYFTVNGSTMSQWIGIDQVGGMCYLYKDSWSGMRMAGIRLSGYYGSLTAVNGGNKCRCAMWNGVGWTKIDLNNEHYYYYK